MPSLQFKQLLANLNSVFEKGPLPILAMQLSFSLVNAAAFITIDNRTLTVRIDETNLSTSPFDSFYRDRETRATIDVGGNVRVIRPVETLTYDLTKWTLGQLVDDLNSCLGFTAMLLDTRQKNRLALALLDGVSEAPLATPVNLSIATNPLWIFLRPIAVALENHETNIDTALAQLNIITSQKFFADFWGAALDVVRRNAEADIDYTQRIVDTVLLKRDNNKALEAIILKELGLDVTIEDLLPLLLDINNASVSSFIPGEVYNVCNFLVTGGVGGQALLDLVNKHRAAGTRAFYVERLDVSLQGTGNFTVDFYDASLFDANFAERDFAATIDVGGNVSFADTDLPAWVVGMTPLPGSVIA